MCRCAIGRAVDSGPISGARWMVAACPADSGASVRRHVDSGAVSGAWGVFSGTRNLPLEQQLGDFSAGLALALRVHSTPPLRL